MEASLFDSSTLVSVVIPTYNVGKFIRPAVESVLAQSHSRLEVIVVNDGSTDATMSHLYEIDDQRLHKIDRKNGGLSSARNFGARASSGDVIAFLDADDYWRCDKVALSLPLLSRHVAVGSKMRYVSDSGRALPSAAGEDPSQKQSQIREGRLMPFPISGILFRRDTVDAAGDFDEGLIQSEDIDFLARVAQLGTIGWSPDSLGFYRLRAGALSSTKYAEQRAYWRFVQSRIEARSHGEDVTVEEFMSTYSPSPLELSRDRAGSFYRRGGLRLSERDIRGALDLFRAFLASPSYTSSRMLRHLRS